ncbi:hypothetical protein GALL_436350 [mine drainage metagenome]|uniref:Uncharacterized protein n=1 Tax=mine drainage metagenome TaxID=410659 RepID=A0A1J5PUA2_9ZZZZ
MAVAAGGHGHRAAGRPVVGRQAHLPCRVAGGVPLRQQAGDVLRRRQVIEAVRRRVGLDRQGRHVAELVGRIQAGEYRRPHRTVGADFHQIALTDDRITLRRDAAAERACPAVSVGWQVVERELRVGRRQAGAVDHRHRNAAEDGDLAGGSLGRGRDVDQSLLAVSPYRNGVGIGAGHGDVPRQDGADGDDLRPLVAILAVGIEIHRQTHRIVHSV